MRVQNGNGQCSSSIGTFAVMLAPYHRFAIQSWNVIEFLSPFAARFFCSWKFFNFKYLYLHFVSKISFSFNFL